MIQFNVFFVEPWFIAKRDDPLSKDPSFDELASFFEQFDPDAWVCLRWFWFRFSMIFLEKRWKQPMILGYILGFFEVFSRCIKQMQVWWIRLYCFIMTIVVIVVSA